MDPREQRPTTKQPSQPGLMPNTPTARPKMPTAPKASFQAVVSGYSEGQSYNTQKSGRGRRLLRILLIIVGVALALAIVYIATRTVSQPSSPQNLSEATKVSFQTIEPPEGFTQINEDNIHYVNSTNGSCDLTYGIFPKGTFSSDKIADIMPVIVGPLRTGGADVSDPISTDSLTLQNAKGDVSYQIPTSEFISSERPLVSASRYSIQKLANGSYLVILQVCTSADESDPITKFSNLKPVLDKLRLNAK